MSSPDAPTELLSTHGIEAARALASGTSLGDVGGLVGDELLIGAAYTVAGMAVIRGFEWLSRRGAFLSQF